MTELNTGRFCGGCIAKAGENGLDIACAFKQAAEKLADATRAERNSGTPNHISPSNRFSRLAQAARNTMDCPQIAAVSFETGSKINPILGRSFSRIKLVPSKPTDTIVDYIGEKARSDRNRI